MPCNRIILLSPKSHKILSSRYKELKCVVCGRMFKIWEFVVAHFTSGQKLFGGRQDRSMVNYGHKITRTRHYCIHHALLYKIILIKDFFKSLKNRQKEYSSVVCPLINSYLKVRKYERQTLTISA